MGTIRGDLSVLSLANLVQLLVQDRSSGLLTLESGSDRRILRISPAGIRLVRGSQRCHRLERVLRHSINIQSEPSDEFSIRIGRLVREWMLEEVCELFPWSRGTFQFEKTEAGAWLEDGPFDAAGPVLFWLDSDLGPRYTAPSLPVCKHSLRGRRCG